MKRKIAPSKFQPDKFEFSQENKKKIDSLLEKYPYKQSVILPLLHLVQEQHKNWVPISAMEKIGEILEMPYLKVVEIASFYTMINLAPVGKYLVQLCRTTPCWLRGAEELRSVLTKEMGLKPEEVCGNFTFREVECLGACNKAPVMQINEKYEENLTPQKLRKIMKDLKDA